MIINNVRIMKMYYCSYIVKPVLIREGGNREWREWIKHVEYIYIYIIEEGGNHCRYLFQWGGVHVKSKLSKEK